MKKEKLVEVCRSFTYKLNAGNYESRDFFCSQKCECLESEAVEKSEVLYQFVKNEVIKSVNSYKAEQLIPKVEPKEPISEEEKKKIQRGIEMELKDNPNWQRANKHE